MPSVSSAPFWAWWLVPVVLTGVVVCVVRLAHRERRPRDGAGTVADYERFRAAMHTVRSRTSTEPSGEPPARRPERPGRVGDARAATQDDAGRERG